MTRIRTILQVGTHSTLNPIHGGQHRSHNIGRALEKAGYALEARLARAIMKDGRLGDGFLYACLRH